jgi:hypothetical protein
VEDRVNRHDREAWQSARTLGDLGELTAQWIEGKIGEQPGYNWPSDIEEPEMVRPLAALNRAGYMTAQSQAGFSGIGFDGLHWAQSAAVEGFADAVTARRIFNHANIAGLHPVIHEPPSRWSWRISYERAFIVTWHDGAPYTRFGAQLPRTHLRSGVTGYGMCHRDAKRAVCDAWQVTVIDPEPGRPGLLWATLTSALNGKSS